jgi:glycosyltransferase involved in cell wall biosynthesis
MNKLKTLFVTYGGAHYRIFNILGKNFDNVSIMDARFKKDFEKHLGHISAGSMKFSKSKIHLFNSVLKNSKNVDIVIANCPISGALTYFASFFNRKKRVFLMCQDFYEYFDVSEKNLLKRIIFGNILKFFIRLSVRKSHVIALSNHIKKRARAYGAKKVQVIPIYGINTSIFKPKIINHLKFPTNKKIILTTARVAPEKGLSYILKAISFIDNVYLIMVGPGDLNQLKNLVNRYNVQDKVKIVGEIDPDEIADYYNACDIFVLPSLKEGLGLSSGEALACKKPVVASNTGGIPDIVIHEKTGLLVEPANVGQLRDAINRFLSSEQLCQELANKGYNHIKENYEEKRVVNKFVLALNNVIIFYS